MKGEILTVSLSRKMIIWSSLVCVKIEPNVSRLLYILSYVLAPKLHAGTYFPSETTKRERDLRLDL